MLCIFMKVIIENIKKYYDKENLNMKLQNLYKRFVLYGALFVLCNQIEANGSEAFPDITMKQHFLMVSLNLFEDEFPTLKEAGDLIGCSYQNVKRMAVQLAEKGFLQIMADNKDKRKLRLIPTDRFRELRRKNDNVAECFMDKLYKDISESDLEVTFTTIQKMIENINMSRKYK